MISYRVLTIAVVTGFSLFSCFRCTGDDQNDLNAGAAAVDISPVDLPAYMNGGFLQRKVDRVADPLYARALVLRSGTEEIAIAIVDSCMFPTKLCDQIKQITHHATGIKIDRILISCTHTHSAPSVMQCLGCPPDENYLAFVPGKVAQAIAIAHSRLEPAKLGWSVVNAEDLTHCRRWITLSDRMGTDPFGRKTVRAMMHPGYQNPNYTNPAGPIDPWLSIVSLISQEEDRPICVLSNFSMHYFGGGGGFSADYFGDVVSRLENQFNVKNETNQRPFVAMMSQGTSGDLHWMDYSQPTKSINRKDYSKKIADRIFDAIGNMTYQSDISLAMEEIRLNIHRRTPSPTRRQWARPINTARQDRSPKNQTEVYALQTEWLHENPVAEVVLQAIRIGELGVTAMPNEVYGITGLKIKRQSPLNLTFNLELANGATGYIPPPEQHRIGGYTTWPASTAGLDEKAEPLIVENILSLLEKVSNRKRRQVTPPETPYSKMISSLQPFCYWRMDDMDALRVADVTGKHHGQFRGGVALFLPGPNGPGFLPSVISIKDTRQTQASYGSRSVYLAGGSIQSITKWPLADSTVTLWFSSSRNPGTTATDQVILSNDKETFCILGTNHGTGAGHLGLIRDEKTIFGKSLLATRQWHFLAVTRSQNKIQVFLDGKNQPEITLQISDDQALGQISIGTDGKENRNFDGLVDEIAVFEKPLQRGKISLLYKTSGTTPPTPPKSAQVYNAKPRDNQSRADYSKTILDSDPVAYWRLHKEKEKTTCDLVSKRIARYQGKSSALSAHETRKNFEGGRIRTSFSEVGKNYSVEFWFRNEIPLNARPVTAYLFSRSPDGIEGSPGDNLGIGGTHSHQGRLIVFNGNRKGQLLAGKATILPGGWSHVVFIRDGKNVRVHLNGQPEPEINGELPIDFPDNNSDWFFGGRSDQFANLIGMLEEIAIYDRVLKPDEIQRHFSAAKVTKIKTGLPRNPGKPDGPRPTAAIESLDKIHVPEGFRVELVAAEPLIRDPVAIDWGLDGKLWVAEMSDYPLGVDGNGQAGGRIRFLEDTDQDGKYDQSVLFADGLNFPNGILCWQKGVIVTAAPEILYLEDSTGDGRADIRETLYRGFNEGNQQLRVNGLRRGLDNWIYCASGSHHPGYGKGSQIISTKLGTRHQIGSRDFRIKPETGEIDPQSGPSQFGRTRDDWGHWFGVQNSHPLWHYVLADQHVRRNQNFAPPNPKFQVVTPANPRVYPASTLQKRYHSFDQSGRFTSACSPTIYRDKLLYESDASRHAFICEPFHNLVQHNLIYDKGVSFTSLRKPGKKGFDFFSSSDRWCRPVMARTGPEGALWIVDMYRYMIEHPEWLPKNGQDELRPWFRSGYERGRIYRVVHANQGLKLMPRLDHSSSEELVTLLEHPNGWVRDNAQAQLIRLNVKETIPLLIKMASECREPLGRLHALWTLSGMKSLPPDTLVAALSDPHAGIRTNALRLSASHQVDVIHFRHLAKDPDPKIQLELAATLGYYKGKEAALLLGAILRGPAADPYIMANAISSLRKDNIYTVLEFVVNSPEMPNEMLIPQLIQLALDFSEPSEIVRIFNVIDSKTVQQNTTRQLRSMACFLDSLNRKKITIDQLPTETGQKIARIIDQARQSIGNPNASLKKRFHSIPLLCREKQLAENDLSSLRKILVPQEPLELQEAVLNHLATLDIPLVSKLLLQNWRSHSPHLRRKILDVIKSRKIWVAALKQAIHSGDISITELSASLRQDLLTRYGNDSDWKNLFSPDRSQNRNGILERFKTVLTLDGSAAKGAIHYRKLCLNCHKVGVQGHAVGPDLASITDKSKASLLTSILDPSSTVEEKYMDFLIETVDGRTINGLIATETGSSLTIVGPEGKTHLILRKDIVRLTSTRRSLMPAALDEELQPTDMADLIKYVQKLGN